MTLHSSHRISTLPIFQSCPSSVTHFCSQPFAPLFPVWLFTPKSWHTHIHVIFTQRPSMYSLMINTLRHINTCKAQGLKSTQRMFHQHVFIVCVCWRGGGSEFWNTRCLVLWQIGHLSWVHWLVFLGFFYLDAYWSGEISLDSLEWLTRVRIHPGKQRFSSVLTQRSLFCKKVNCYGPVFTQTHTFHGFVLQMYQIAVHTWSPCTYLCTAVSLYCVHILAVFLCVCVFVSVTSVSSIVFNSKKWQQAFRRLRPIHPSSYRRSALDRRSAGWRAT